MMMMIMITTSKTDVGEACSTHGIEQKLVQSFDGQTLRGDYLEDHTSKGNIFLMHHKRTV
jgi:hypothetical protein